MKELYNYYVYIMASKSGTIYIGVTNSLYRRVKEHRNSLVEGFSKKYKCTKLIYFEQTEDIGAAIAREKQLKKWRRGKKENLIRSKNPGWRNLILDWDEGMIS